MSISVNISALKKKYKNNSEHTLKGVNLSIHSNDKYGILGPNGAGKTTLISILCGIFGQSAGEIIFSKGEEQLSFKKMQNTIGFVPQEYAFYHELSARQNLEYFGAMYNLNAEQIKSKSAFLLDILNLSSVADKKVEIFSGGMKRRVNLAIGVIHDPEILFLDEPTVGVDVQSKVAILKFLNELNEKGTTIIYTSHHLEEAQEFCNRISLIDNGEIILEGETASILHKNKTDNLKELFIQYTGEAYRD